MGMTEVQALKIAKELQFEGNLLGPAANEIKRLYDLFIAVDATQVEINPLVETRDGRVFCVDAKMNFDDSASYRQKDIFAYETFEEHVNFLRFCEVLYFCFSGSSRSWCSPIQPELHRNGRKHRLPCKRSRTRDGHYGSDQIARRRASQFPRRRRSRNRGRCFQRRQNHHFGPASEVCAHQYLRRNRQLRYHRERSRQRCQQDRIERSDGCSFGRNERRRRQADYDQVGTEDSSSQQPWRGRRQGRFLSSKVTLSFYPFLLTFSLRFLGFSLCFRSCFSVFPGTFSFVFRCFM